MPPAETARAPQPVTAPARPPWRTLTLGALAVLVGGLGLVLPSFWLFLATGAVISAVTALSVGIVFGRAGMISLCQLSFAAIGAFAVAAMNTRGILSLPFQILLGGLVAVPFGLLIGLPALRLRGVNLAIVTLGFASAVDVVLGLNAFPGADSGQYVARPAALAGDPAYFAFCWAVFVALALGLGWLSRRRAGLAWDAVRRSERATAALGLSVTATKLWAFGLSAFVAGVGGGLLIGQLLTVSRANFEPVFSLMSFALGVMLATQYWEGALVAGVAMALVPEVLRRTGLPQDLTSLLFALGAVEALFRGTGGLAARLRLAASRRRARDLPAELPPLPAPSRGGGRTGPVASAPASSARRALVLELSHLTVSYGQVTALSDVNLSVEAGTVAALIGPNGAGKSTLIDAVTGFKGYAGSVALGGRPIDAVSAHGRARLGLRRSFQQDRTIADLSVEQYLRLLSGRDLGRAELLEALHFLGGPHPERPMDTVDVGTRRLVEVAGLLAARPQIALLDEPGAGLDEAESLRFAARLREVPATFGCAVLLVEHDMALVAAACSRVTVLDFGHVIASGGCAEVLGSPEVVRAYLGGEDAA